jgi:hypothetical protein
MNRHPVELAKRVPRTVVSRPFSRQRDVDRD